MKLESVPLAAGTATQTKKKWRSVTFVDVIYTSSLSHVTTTQI